MKTKQGHTPGPWEMKRLNSDLGQRFSFIGGHNSPEGSCVVASTPAAHGTENLRVQEADARLIAAAPDLLAACDAAIALLDTTTPSGRKAYEMARAAIDKAEGR